MIDLPIKLCKRCAQEFRQRRVDQIFCSPNCRQHHHRKMDLRGGAVAELLIAWRTSRGSKKGVLGEIAHIVDGWIKDDRA